MKFPVVERLRPEHRKDYEQLAADAIERILELEAVLREIAEGQTDEGGNRRNHPNATAMARQLFKLE